MNLFSTFDPTTFNYYSMNWISSTLLLMFFPMEFWLIPSRMNMMMKYLLNYLIYEFKNLLKTNNLFNLLMFISMFYFILFNNSMGMFNYIFTSTSHLSMSLSFSMSMWLSFMLFGWMKNSNHMFIHGVPMGTPQMLLPFMVMIELISNLIRPITLAIRLSANMITGHLLMNLIFSMAFNLKFLKMSSLIFFSSTLIVLELMVSLIQAYVFSILLILYSIESKST